MSAYNYALEKTDLKVSAILMRLLLHTSQVRLEVTLFSYRPDCFCCVNQVDLILTSLHVHEKLEVCIKARPPPTSLSFIG